METPRVPVNFVPASEGETFKLGTVTIRIMEDGSRTGEPPFTDLESMLTNARDADSKFMHWQ
jgi:hypothetical protein